jgi:hypothetical protein
MLKQVVLRSLFLPILFFASGASAQIYRLASGSQYLGRAPLLVEIG